MTKRVGLILSGAGVFDGTELHEAVLCLLALDRANAKVTVIAPDKPLTHVIDHQTGTIEEGAQRNLRSEAARIARGPVSTPAEVDPKQFDALLLPGGFGVAKNLSSWAFEGANCSVDPDVADLLRGVHEHGGWIGACCIAPVLLAKVFGAPIQVTIGRGDAEHAAVEQTGATHVRAGAGDVVCDDAMRVLTTPAYMDAKRIRDLPTGIDELVRQLIAA
jgi:enhancing lycopene biosynthesis protein 2